MNSASEQKGTSDLIGCEARKDIRRMSSVEAPLNVSECHNVSMKYATAYS